MPTTALPQGFKERGSLNHEDPVSHLLTSEFLAAVPAALRGGLLSQLLLRALSPPEPAVWRSFRMHQQQQQQQKQQQPQQQEQQGFVLGVRLDGLAAAADDHLLRLLLQLLLNFDSWLGFSGLSEQQQHQQSECVSAAAGSAEAASADEENSEGSRLVSYGLEGGFCAPGSSLRQHQLSLFAALSNAVEEGVGHPFGALLSWLLLLISYCGCAVPYAALSSSLDNSDNGKNEILTCFAETAAAATARVGVYADLLRVLRLRHSVCPLPVGPPHLVPRHLPLMPLLSVDKRVLPSECKTIPTATGDCAAVDSETQQQQQKQCKLSVLAPSEATWPTSPLSRKQQEQAAQLFGCAYTPKYPEQRHCHLPDPLLPPHVSCAVVLYNLKRLGALAIQWASAVAPRAERADRAAEWAVAAVSGSSCPVSEATRATAGAEATPSAGAAAGKRTGCTRLDGGEDAASSPPYTVKGESCEHVLQWLQWQQRSGPLLFSCGLNEEGPLGLGEAAYFPIDPVLQERDNFVSVAKGADVWFCCQPQQVVALPGAVRSVSAGVRCSAAVTTEGLLFNWGAAGCYREDANGSMGTSSNGALIRHPADHSRDYGLSRALRFSWIDVSVFSDPRAKSRELEHPEHREDLVYLPALLKGTTALPRLKAMPSLPAATFAAVCCGPDFCAAVTAEGGLYTWGNNASGVLGVGDTHSRRHPTAVSPRSFASSSEQQQQQQLVRQVACGNSHMAAITAAGCLFVWGSNSHGQCGFSMATEAFLFPRELLLVDLSLVPLTVLPLVHSILAAHKSSADTGVGYLAGHSSSGDSKAMLLAADSAGYAFLVSTAGEEGAPSLQRGLLGFSQVACGSLHTLSLGAPRHAASQARSAEERVPGGPQGLYTWGSNTGNCLGLNEAEEAATARAPPTRLPPALFADIAAVHPQMPARIEQIAAGGICGAALSEQGDVWLWGDLQAFVESGDAACWSAAPPTLFELSEEEGPHLPDGRPSKGRGVQIRRVAFAAEGARLLLFTEKGDLIAVGDGCVQQQLLPLDFSGQQQQRKPFEDWNKAAATVAPRFWADKSRRERLRGACRIRVPHRRIVEAAAGLDHFLLATLPTEEKGQAPSQQPVAFLRELHRPPALLRPRRQAASPRSSSTTRSSNIIHSGSSSSADSTRLSSCVSSGSGKPPRDTVRRVDMPAARTFAGVRSHSASPSGTAQIFQLQQEPEEAKQLWQATLANPSTASGGRSFAAAARDVAAAGLHLTLRHLASAGEGAAKAAAARAAEAAERVADGQGAAVMESLLDRIDRGSGAVLSALSSGIAYILPGTKSAPAVAGAACSRQEAVSRVTAVSADPRKSLIAAGACPSGALPCRATLSFGESTAAIAVPAVRVGPPHSMGASLRPLLRQNHSQLPLPPQQQQLWSQQQQPQRLARRMPPRSKSLVELPSYRDELRQKNSMVRQQLEGERLEAWKRLSSLQKLSSLPPIAQQRNPTPPNKELSQTTRSRMGASSLVLPDIPQRQRPHLKQQQQQQQQQQQ
ncbi:uncharacterized protein LOC34620439, partial [Cyclospora cayetanensis]|uniref:Uncharacterized protein LOC34620439 n=1 Tax=Cyclospora cayetanensis TaxID=88456 RepID=A0A6P6RQT7_9EIME